MNEIKNPPSERHYGVAAYIVGVLIYEGVIPPAKNGKWAGEHVETAMRLVAACLRDAVGDDFDHEGVPFDW